MQPSLSQNQSPSLSAGKAVLIGHMIVTIPILIIFCVFVGVGVFLMQKPLLFLLIGFVTSWLWWSFVIPRWRKWALGNGADEEKLQKLGVLTGLVWPKGWIFEKTEFKVNDK